MEKKAKGSPGIEVPKWVYLNRTAGGGGNNSDTGGDAITYAVKGEGTCKGGSMFEQPQAAGNIHDDVCVGLGRIFAYWQSPADIGQCNNEHFLNIGRRP